MKCSDIDRILDGHALSGLNAAERSKLNAHLIDCSACVESVSAYEALRDERSPDPRPGLLRSIVAGLPSRAEPAVMRRSPLAWQTLGGLAATVAVVMIAVFSVVDPGSPGDSGLGEGIATPVLMAQTVDDRNRSSLPPRRLDLPVATFVEGEDFVALPSAVAQNLDLSDEVIAWLFYMWSCLHCYEFEALLSEWIAQQDANTVSVVRVPVQWNPALELQARAFYTAEVLGVADAVSDDFYAAIHERGESLSTEEEIAALFMRHGVDRAEFLEAFESDRVAAELERGRALAIDLGIDAAPSIVVDGRFLTSPGMAGSHQRATAVLDGLVADALRRRAAGTDAGPVEACDVAQISATDSRIEELRRELKELLDRYSEQYPEVLVLEESIARSEATRANLLTQERDNCLSERPVFGVDDVPVFR